MRAAALGTALSGAALALGSRLRIAEPVGFARDGAGRIVGGPWQLVWEDDFDGASLNSSSWNVRTNESHCCPAELQLYVPGAVSVANSVLTLTTARVDDVPGPGGTHYNFTSGWVDTKGKLAFKYGLFEARVLLPAPNATGAWPAFWTLPNSTQCWPTGGEIDWYEATSQTILPGLDQVYGSYRWGTTCDNDMQPLPGGAYPPLGSNTTVDWAGTWHIIGGVWNATSISFFVDDVYYETVSASAVVMPTAAQYIIFDTAVAWYLPPDANAVYPTTHQIDWVRVYQ